MRIKGKELRKMNKEKISLELFGESFHLLSDNKIRTQNCFDGLKKRIFFLQEENPFLKNNQILFFICLELAELVDSLHDSKGHDMYNDFKNNEHFDHVSELTKKRNENIEFALKCIIDMIDQEQVY